MSASAQKIELGEYATRCVEVIKSFVPGRENEVEPAIVALAGIYAKEDKDTVEKRFEDEYNVYKAAAEVIETTDQAEQKLNEFK
jgi:hypothetical protein